MLPRNHYLSSLSIVSARDKLHVHDKLAREFFRFLSSLYPMLIAIYSSKRRVAGTRRARG